MKPEPLCYDNGVETADRYTIFPRGRGWGAFIDNKGRRVRFALALSDDPSHPLGVSQWGECWPGRHLGRRIAWGDMPENVRRHVTARINE